MNSSSAHSVRPYGDLKRAGLLAAALTAVIVIWHGVGLPSFPLHSGGPAAQAEPTFVSQFRGATPPSGPFVVPLGPFPALLLRSRPPRAAAPSRARIESATPVVGRRAPVEQSSKSSSPAPTSTTVVITPTASASPSARAIPSSLPPLPSPPSLPPVQIPSDPPPLPQVPPVVTTPTSPSVQLPPTPPSIPGLPG